MTDPSGPPVGTSELGVDIIKVERIRGVLDRFGDRFLTRILTHDERAYVRGRPETLAGRWAAKEAVSKVLGLGVRGVGWREIEIVRLPTGQPTVQLHDRARDRAAQLEMGRIAVSITHERDYAVAVAYGVRNAGGAYLLPPGIEGRLDRQEERLRAQLERIRDLDADVRRARAQTAERADTVSDQPALEASDDPRRSRDPNASRDPSGPPSDGPRRSASELMELTASAVGDWLPLRPARSHKGTFGTLVIVAGSLEYVGAALLAASAALRAGTGLVCLAVPEPLQPVVAGRVPEAITLGLPVTLAGELEGRGSASVIWERGPSAVLLGPGLQVTQGLAGALQTLLRDPRGAAVPAVLDAGALTALSTVDDWWTSIGSQAVLTPHPGEFARLDGRPVGPADDERADRAREAARRWGQVVVLKGARTVIAEPGGQVARSPFSTPALATAGTGDVLAGTIGALLAQGMAPFPAACTGVFLHAAAGERMQERLGGAGLIASDLPLEIARIRGELAPNGLARDDRSLEEET